MRPYRSHMNIDASISTSIVVLEASLHFLWKTDLFATDEYELGQSVRGLRLGRSVFWQNIKIIV